jgi:arylsulfatase A-like enzyme
MSKRIAEILTVVMLVALPPFVSAAQRAPNIVLIITDQQRFDMLSCAGNEWLKTPNLDRLAAAGTRFQRAYCAFPLCSPSRFSMFSGVMPSRIGQESNEVVPVPDEVLHNAMGHVLARAGYETVYAGKIHLPCPERPQSVGYGFQRNLSLDVRDTMAACCAAYLREKHDRPFLLVASFNNPHDICSLGTQQYEASHPVKKSAAKKGPTREERDALACLEAALRRPEGVSEETFFGKLCPTLPSNLEESPELKDVMGLKAGKIDFEHTQWTNRDWQLHRWAYARLTEQVDAQIGVVLAALREAGLERETLVVATSDHGEMDASHRLGHKHFLYEEAVRVPLIMAWRGHTVGGLVDREHLVSTGLDLIPTLCDFAGVPAPSALKGLSVRPLAEGRPVTAWRNSLVVENHNGRAYRGDTWKYVVYSAKGEPAKEAVIDLASDPGEMHDAARDPQGRQRLETGRDLLPRWYQEHGESLDLRYRVAP